MRYDSIVDIFSANQKFRANLIDTLRQISAAEASVATLDEKWSIQQIAEHVSIVDHGITRICAKLLAASEAAGNPADGSFRLTEEFGRRAAEIAAMRVEAPDQVKPSGNVPLAESLEKLEQNSSVFESLRETFEKFDFSGEKFPHPFFGPLTAGEWLVMAGLHQHRHTKQIETLAAKIRQ